eukprot:TRINITY_DN8208_c0_g1_i1.p1 TRINITY_DN8208_c0_g1~~TRINITY_DN8208_c0_g1_i1.p1  ORF type:complete len:250 (-),score=-2.70 TRINITY_DN8208_c0_g1_i1:47-754(-)
MARERGLRGDTRAELVKLLAATMSLASPGGPAKPAATSSILPNPPPPSASPAAAAAAAAGGSGSRGVAAEAEVLPPLASELPPGPIAPAGAAGAAGSAASGAGPSAKEVKTLATEERQAEFVRTVLVGGVGLAAISLVLPFATSNSIAPGSTAEVLAEQLGQETAVLLNSLLTTQARNLNELQALMPLISPDLDPTTRAARAALFCQEMPSNQRSVQTDKFCKTVAQIGIRPAAQ